MTDLDHLAHADALRRWHLRQPPYDDPSLPAPRRAIQAQQEAVRAEAMQQVPDDVVTVIVAWASNHYPTRQTSPPDFAHWALDDAAIASILARLPDRRALLALMDQPWFRERAPQPLVTSQWNQLPRETL